MRLFSIFATITSLLIFVACTKDIGLNPDLIKKQTSACDSVTWTKHIKPIIDNNCISCHFAGSGIGDFSIFAEIKGHADDGMLKQRVIDGNPSFMPQSGRLPDAEINLITCWLNAGAPNN